MCEQVRWQRAYRLKNGTAKILALSQDMALEDNIHYSIERPTQFTWRLRIRNIQVTDEGMYQCYVLTNQNSKAEDRRIISVVCVYHLLISVTPLHYYSYLLLLLLATTTTTTTITTTTTVVE